MSKQNQALIDDIYQINQRCKNTNSSTPSELFVALAICLQTQAIEAQTDVALENLKVAKEMLEVAKELREDTNERQTIHQANAYGKGQEAGYSDGYGDALAGNKPWREPTSAEKLPINKIPPSAAETEVQ